MNCDRVRLLLNGYIDGELDLVNALDMEEHLRNCSACSRQMDALTALHAATSSKSLYYPAPAQLEKKIRVALRKAEPAAEPAQMIFSRRWFAPAAVLIVILALIVGFFGPNLITSNQEAQVAQQVQTAHVRSLMADHLMDVASSDQHTVKPWFNGKLDFSPPVTDLAAQGFPLIGGRLDYLDGRQVAALVYQRNKHYINLFIWPSTNNGTMPVASTYNGYHLYHWSQTGMTFWAVSDLNIEELQAFVKSFQKSLQ